MTPRPAGAMLKYYLSGSDIVLDSNHPDDLPDLRRWIADSDVAAVIRWGGQMEPRGAAARTLGERPPDGRTTVDSTIVSWWRTNGHPAEARSAR